MKVAVIGGGAAGFFAAINVRENFPKASVVIYEKSDKVLAKVKISGGGRCNFTNAITPIKEFAKAYPRGGMKLRKAFGLFANVDIMQWFAKRGVPYVVQEDNSVFPVSQDSQTIINCFLQETKRLNVDIKTESKVEAIIPNLNSISLIVDNEHKIYDKVIVTTGGSPKRKGLEWLEKLGHTIINPVPSLFTFNMPTESIVKLMGIVVDNTLVSIRGSKLQTRGALLITHWGMSGPVILKLSAFGARALNEKDYNFEIQVNWIDEKNNDLVFDYLSGIIKENPKKKIGNIRPFGLQTRLWYYILEKVKLSSEKVWSELGRKQQNKLVAILTNDTYKVQGKTTFKEEFVTSGGISLTDIDFKTMQSKIVPNLYFAGEVLDIDGITGGFNLQAAWTTGFIAAKLL
jgi:predicted Rossmann fold flavoprotein